MAERLLADLVLVFHAAFILFALLGGLLVLMRRAWIWLHLPAFLWAGLIELTGGICPLTPLENRLRVLGGAEAYQGDFIGRYLMPLVYPDNLTRGVQIGLGLFVLLFNTVLYVTAWRRSRRRTTGAGPEGH